MQINDKVFIMFEGTVEKIEKVNHFNDDDGFEIFVTVRSDTGPSGRSMAIVDAKKVNPIKTDSVKTNNYK